MMTMELLFALQINSEMTVPITINSVNLKTKIEELKREAAEKWNLPKDSLGKMTLQHLNMASFCHGPCYPMLMNFLC